MSRPTLGRWNAETARRWANGTGWLVGANYIPRTAANQIEMWSPETFDPGTIDEELGWAERIGLNAIRVFLHDILYRDDSRAFLERIDRMLQIAAAHRIRTMLVFFDDVWDPVPRVGAQREPTPFVHNSAWVQSPGGRILASSDLHDELEEYVQAVVERFRVDERVFAWDVYNEPGNPNPAYASREIPEKAERSLRLLESVFRWARASGPSQPLTAGVWDLSWVDSENRPIERCDLPPLTRTMLERSDVISFHAYTDAERTGALIAALKRWERPLLCTEWMARTAGSTIEDVLPVLARERVGAIQWGLVQGRTQTHCPWSSWVEEAPGEPETWFHDLLRPDGSPYDPREIAILEAAIASSPLKKSGPSEGGERRA